MGYSQKGFGMTGWFQFASEVWHILCGFELWETTTYHDP